MPNPIPPGIVVMGKKGLTAAERRDFIDLDFSSPDEDFFGMEYVIPDYWIRTDEWYDPNSVIGACFNYYAKYILPAGQPKAALSGLLSFDERIWNWIHAPGFWLHEKVVSMIGLKRALDLDYKLLDETILETYNERLRQAKLKQKEEAKLDYEVDPEPDDQVDDEFKEDFTGYSDSPLKDDDYFVWLTNKNMKPHKDWRYDYFVSINMKYESLNGFYNLGDAVNQYLDRPEPTHCILDEVERHLYTRSGGKVDDQGYPVLSTNVIFDDDPWGGSDGSQEVDMTWFG
jgi:hypothetical protein